MNEDNVKLSFNANVLKEFSFMAIGKGYMAVREEVFINNILQEQLVQEFIVKEEELVNFNFLNKPKPQKVFLAKENFVEIIRTYTYGSTEYNEALSWFKISKPYSYLLENGIEKVSLYETSQILSTSFDDILNEKTLTIPLIADYIDARLDNYTYDLDAVLDFVKNRKDVKIVSDGIVDIDWFNSTEYRNKTISMIYYPPDEIFNKVLTELVKKAKINLEENRKSSALEKNMILRSEIYNALINIESGLNIAQFKK